MGIKDYLKYIPLEYPQEKSRIYDYVYLDCRHLDKNELIKHFPNINEKCLSLGIDISKDLIPVVPAAPRLHRVAGIPSLFCGQVTFSRAATVAGHGSLRRV